MDNKKITEDLELIISEFNDRFAEWMDSTRCRASFEWRYGKDREPKSMQLQSIDLIVYRKESHETVAKLEAMMKKCDIL